MKEVYEYVYEVTYMKLCLIVIKPGTMEIHIQCIYVRAGTKAMHMNTRQKPGATML